MDWAGAVAVGLAGFAGAGGAAAVPVLQGRRTDSAWRRDQQIVAIRTYITTMASFQGDSLTDNAKPGADPHARKLIQAVNDARTDVSIFCSLALSQMVIDIRTDVVALYDARGSENVHEPAWKIHEHIQAFRSQARTDLHISD
jgi:hypothetical protein